MIAARKSDAEQEGEKKKEGRN